MADTFNASVHSWTNNSTGNMSTGEARARQGDDGDGGGTNENGFILIPSVTVQAGTIASVYLKGTVYYGAIYNEWTVHGVTYDSGEPAAPSTIAQFNALPLTTASTPVQNNDMEDDDPWEVEVTDIFEELIADAGWSSGSDMAFTMHEDYEPPGEGSFRCDGVYLEVTYEDVMDPAKELVVFHRSQDTLTDIVVGY